MKNFVEIASTILLLIAIYLVLSRPTATVGILETLGQTSLEGIKTLQGR